MNTLVPSLSFVLINLVSQACLATYENYDEGSKPISEKFWNFNVYLDEKLIGQHKFVVEDFGTEIRVSSEAEFKYKILGITLYTYQHENIEYWKDGCLQEIFASTNDNGDRLYVKGQKDDGGFFIETLDKKTTLPECIQTFAYWDKSLLQQDSLLNTQTGEFMPVSVQSTDRSSDQDNLTITGDQIKIELEYLADRWLSLKSMTETGQELTYRQVEVTE